MNNIRFEERAFCATHEEQMQLMVCVSGYEPRATYLYRLMAEKGWLKAVQKTSVVGFANFREMDSRVANDNYYLERGLEPKIIDGGNPKELLSWIRDLVQTERKDTSVKLHVDFSAMPRRWYCSLACERAAFLKPGDELVLWYSMGRYEGGEFPTAGVEDFEVFSGRPSFVVRPRTHILGLGFDSVRTEAIRLVVDPETIVAYYGASGMSENDDRALMVNRELIGRAAIFFGIPLHDFVSSYRIIRGVVCDTLRDSDVVLLPDGPKIGVLAACMVAHDLEERGVTCFHVRSRRGKEMGVPKVEGSGLPVGVRFEVEES